MKSKLSIIVLAILIAILMTSIIIVARHLLRTLNDLSQSIKSQATMIALSELSQMQKEYQNIAMIQYIILNTQNTINDTISQ
jgi:uncharacterized membrane protein